MLNLTELEMYPAYKCKMPTIVSILTFINRIKFNTPSEQNKARIVFISQIHHFTYCEQLKCNAQLN